MTQGMGFNPHYCRHQRLWVPGLRSAWPPGVKGEPTWLALYGPWNVSAASCAQDDLKIVYAPRWDSDLGPRNDSNRFSKARGEAPAPALPGSRMCNLKLSMAQVCGFAFLFWWWFIQLTQSPSCPLQTSLHRKLLCWKPLSNIDYRWL